MGPDFVIFFSFVHQIMAPADCWVKYLCQNRPKKRFSGIDPICFFCGQENILFAFSVNFYLEPICVNRFQMWIELFLWLPDCANRHNSRRKIVNPKTGRATLKPDKRAERSLVEQRCRCADAMRMTLKVPIRMVLGVVEHICAIKPARMCWCHAERDLKYDCRRTGF